MSTIMPWSSGESNPCCCGNCSIVGVKSLNGSGYVCGFDEFAGFVSSPPKRYKKRQRKFTHRLNKAASGLQNPELTCGDDVANITCDSGHYEDVVIICLDTYNSDCSVDTVCSVEASADFFYHSFNPQCCNGEAWEGSITSDFRRWISNVEIVNYNTIRYDENISSTTEVIGPCFTDAPYVNSYNPPPARYTLTLWWPGMIATSATFRSGGYTLTGDSCFGSPGVFWPYLLGCLNFSCTLDKYVEETLSEEITLEDVLRVKECDREICAEGDTDCFDCGTYKERYKVPDTPSGCVKAGSSLVAWISTASGHYRSGQSSSFGVLLFDLSVGSEYTLKLTYHRYVDDAAYSSGNFTVLEHTLEFTATAEKEIIAANCNDCAIKKVMHDHGVTSCTNSSFTKVPAVQGFYTKLVKCDLIANDNP